MHALTLDTVRGAFAGSIPLPSAVVAPIECEPGATVWTHIALNPLEPDGLKIETRNQPRARAQCESIVRERLGLPPRAANDNGDGSIDGDTLMGMEFPPIKYIVPPYIVEGLSVLGGKPKVGKSWLALNLAIAVAAGEPALGGAPCEQGDVLYLALEDNRRRLKDRINTVRPFSMKRGGLDRLRLKTEASRIDAGLIDELEAWRVSVKNPRMIVIDVYMKVRPTRRAKEDAYAADYAAVVPLQRYASQHRLAVVLVTHTRKMEAEDPLEAISGTNGVTGAADAVLVLSRNAKGTTLYARGRDIEEIESAVRLDNGNWTVLGNADEVNQSSERRRILDALRAAAEPMGPKDIAAATGLKDGNVRAMLRRMVQAGDVTKSGRALYGVENNGNNDNNETNDSSVSKTT